MLIKQDFYFHHLDAHRPLHIRVPDGPGPFPVMYFFDGHNLFRFFYRRHRRVRNNLYIEICSSKGLHNF